MKFKTYIDERGITLVVSPISYGCAGCVFEHENPKFENCADIEDAVEEDDLNCVGEHLPDDQNYIYTRSLNGLLKIL